MGVDIAGAPDADGPWFLLAVAMAFAVFMFVSVRLIDRRDPRRVPVAVPASWRTAGWMVWLTPWVSSRLPTAVEEALRDRFDPPSWVLPLGFALGGLVLALLLWVGAGLNGHADPRAVPWAAVVFGWGLLSAALFAVVYIRDGEWDGLVLVALMLVLPVTGAVNLARAVRTPVERMGDRPTDAATLRPR